MNLRANRRHSGVSDPIPGARRGALRRVRARWTVRVLVVEDERTSPTPWRGGSPRGHGGRRGLRRAGRARGPRPPGTTWSCSTGTFPASTATRSAGPGRGRGAAAGSDADRHRQRRRPGRGLELGADDYLGKPFAFGRAGRPHPGARPPRQPGRPPVLESATCSSTRPGGRRPGGRPLDLTRKEFGVLEVLSGRAAVWSAARSCSRRSGTRTPTRSPRGPGHDDDAAPQARRPAADRDGDRRRLPDRPAAERRGRGRFARLGGKRSVNHTAPPCGPITLLNGGAAGRGGGDAAGRAGAGRAGRARPGRLPRAAPGCVLHVRRPGRCARPPAVTELVARRRPQRAAGSSGCSRCSPWSRSSASPGRTWWPAGRCGRCSRVTATARRLVGRDAGPADRGWAGAGEQLGELADTFDAMLAPLDAAFDGPRGSWPTPRTSWTYAAVGADTGPRST